MMKLLCKPVSNQKALTTIKSFEIDKSEGSRIVTLLIKCEETRETESLAIRIRRDKNAFLLARKHKKLDFVDLVGFQMLLDGVECSYLITFVYQGSFHLDSNEGEVDCELKRRISTVYG